MEVKFRMLKKIIFDRENLGLMAALVAAAVSMLVMMATPVSSQTTTSFPNTADGSTTIPDTIPIVRQLPVALEANGRVIAYFSEVSGLGSESAVVEFRPGTEDEGNIVKIPGPITWGNIVLKRGITADMTLWQWRQMVETGDTTEFKIDGSIVIRDIDWNEIPRWEFDRGWPSRVHGFFRYKAEFEGAGTSMEELVIVHEGIRRVR